MPELKVSATVTFALIEDAPEFLKVDAYVNGVGYAGQLHRKDVDLILTRFGRIASQLERSRGGAQMIPDVGNALIDAIEHVLKVPQSDPA